jgi:hypothetical protein
MYERINLECYISPVNSWSTKEVKRSKSITGSNPELFVRSIFTHYGNLICVMSTLKKTNLNFGV